MLPQQRRLGCAANQQRGRIHFTALIERLEQRTLLSALPLPPDISPEPLSAGTLSNPIVANPLDINALRTAGFVTLSGTPGSWDQIFDNDASTLNRSENINPAVIQLDFSSPATFSEFRLHTSHAWGDPAYRWIVETANSQSDLDAKANSYRLAVPSTSIPSDQWSSVPLSFPITASIVRLTAWRLTGDNYVHIDEWSLFGTASFNLLSTPRGMDVDSTGRTLVAESGAGRIAIFNAAGQRVGQVDVGGANSPWDVAVDAQDNIFVADTANHRIRKYSPAGAFLLEFGSYGTAPGRFNMPRGIAIDRATNRIYVADTFNHRIQRFLPSGALDTSFAAAGVLGAGAVRRDRTGFDRPMDIAVNPITRQLYIADYGNARIQVFPGSGNEYITTYNAVYHPNNLAFDASANLYIAGEDPNDNYTPYDGRLRVLRPREKLIYDHYTGGLDDLGRYLGGVAVRPDGSIIIADTLNGRLATTNSALTPPIRDLRVDANGSSVTFRWTTATPSPSSVRFGPTTAYGSIVTNPTPTTDHILTIPNTTPNTRLYYRVGFPDTFDGAQRWTPQDVLNTGAPPGQHQFLRLKGAAIIYTDVQPGLGYRRMSNGDLARSRQRFHEMAAFYWRNSGFRLWPDVQIIEINRDITTQSFSLFSSMVNDLTALGFTAADDFDAIWGSSHLADGNFGGGSSAFGRSVGMAQWGGLDTWVAVHEVNHSIDSIYAANDLGKYEFNHGIWAVPSGVGLDFSINGQILRNLLPANFTATRAPYTKILAAPDADNDHLPDDTIRGLINPLPITERTLGASPFSPDTDADGLSDFEEARALIDHNTSLLSPDTDADTIPDGADLNPAYMINDRIGRGTPSIDGAIGLNEGWALLTDRWGYNNDRLVDDNNLFASRSSLYAAWDDHYFYLALRGPASSTEVHFDAGADNWFFGPDNYKLRLDNAADAFSVSVNVGIPDLFRMIDDDGQYSVFEDTDPKFTLPYNGRAFYNQDGEGAGFAARLLTESNVRHQRGGSGNASVWEVAIPWSSRNLYSPPGKRIALNIDISGDKLFETDHAATLLLTSTPNVLPPSAVAAVADITARSFDPHPLTITYTGFPAISAATFDNADIRILGPNNYNILATFVSASPPGDGPSRTVTYKIFPPGGMWESSDEGVYTVLLEPNAVADTRGAAVPAGELARFVVFQPPYNGAPLLLPGRVEAENFDYGAEGVAYHDSEPSNAGGKYRQTAVDLESTTDSGGGYIVGWTQPGEWIEYTVNIPFPATYSIQTRVASQDPGGTFRLTLDDSPITPTLTVPGTGGWQIWQTVTAPSTFLPPGQHVLRLSMLSNGAAGYVGNFNWIDILPDPPYSTVTGLVYEDANANVFHNTAERPLAGQQVFADINRNGLFDPSEPLSVTDAAGLYTFTLPRGTWSLRLLPSEHWINTDAANPAYNVSIFYDPVPGPDFSLFPTTFVGTPGFDSFVVHPAPAGKVEILFSLNSAFVRSYLISPTLLPPAGLLFDGQGGDDVVSSEQTPLRLAANQSLLSLELRETTATLLPASGAPLITSDLTLRDNATLDLATVPLILRTTPATRDARYNEVATAIAAGRSPILLFPRILSTAFIDPTFSIAAIVNARDDNAPLLSSFHNAPIDENALLLSLAPAGDTDLNGVIDADDYFRIDRSALGHPLPRPRDYRAGDFNYDTLITADDYTLIDLSHSLHRPQPFSAVPSPASPADLPLASLAPLSSLPPLPRSSFTKNEDIFL